VISRLGESIKVEIVTGSLERVERYAAAVLLDLEGGLRGSEYFTNGGTARDPPPTLRAMRVYSDFYNKTLLSNQVIGLQ
jgi:hypothetical protein